MPWHGHTLRIPSKRFSNTELWWYLTVYPKKYTHGFVVLCFVVVMQSFIMNSHEVFIHIHQGCFAGTGAIVRLPQCQWSKPDGCGKISQCITTTKHSKAKTVCIFLGIYCIYDIEEMVSWPVKGDNKLLMLCHSNELSKDITVMLIIIVGSILMIWNLISPLYFLHFLS